MDRIASFSNALYNAFCIDVGAMAVVQQDRFCPFPWGLPPGIGADEFVRLHAIEALFKKSEVEASSTAELSTLSKFTTANEKCSRMRKEDFGISSIENPAIGYSINHARELLYRWFETPLGAITMATIEVAARFGPGRSVGLGEKPTLLYFKVGDSVQTASSPFIRSWYESSVSYNPLCEAAEMARKARWGEAQLESVGNLTFVPKSYASKRIVVTEPSLNTYFQLGLGKEMERVLRRETGIDLSLQPSLNQEMARKGSIDQSFSTMDLTQCSDYISLPLAEFMFPPSLVRWMKILRTPSVKFPKQYGGEVVKLSMLSTMGNGFTFPMQTVLLSALVLGVYDTLGIQAGGYSSRNWGVFGDDIIVTPDAFHLLANVLATLGLQVNYDKSFDTGPFRESCGTDWFEGTEVRGVYLRRYDSDQDLFSCFNRLAIWGARHNIPLTNTLALVLAQIRGTCNVIPPDENFESGVMSPLPPCEADENGVWHYHAYVPKLDSFTFEPWEEYSSGIITASSSKRRRMKRWLGDLKQICSGSINEPAVLKALLAGGVRRNKVIMRKTATRFRLVSRESPRWGFSPVGSVPCYGSDVFNRWAEIVHLAATQLIKLES